MKGLRAAAASLLQTALAPGDEGSESPSNVSEGRRLM